MLLRRSIREKVIKSLENHRVTLIIGPRQSGKTTLVKEIGREKDYDYVTLDSLRMLNQAKSDPMGFIRSLKKPVIIDEIQRAPELFLPIKQEVDETQDPGTFILTGSANPLLMPTLGDSLAGRMHIINLLPFSQGELLGLKEEFIQTIFTRGPQGIEAPNISQDAITSLLVKGGYPAIQNMDPETQADWFDSYLRTITERDMKDYSNLAGLMQFPELLELLATRVGGLLNTAELSRASGIPVTTLHRYMNLLALFFLTNLIRAWSSNRGKRLVKSPKLYLVDNGLLSFLLDIDQSSLEHNRSLMGQLLENFVVSELSKQQTWSAIRTRLYHWRTTTHQEVDLILESKAKQRIGIEIKSKETIYPRDFDGLRKCQASMGPSFLHGIILYTGTEKMIISDTLCALPLSALWAR